MIAKEGTELVVLLVLLCWSFQQSMIKVALL